MVDVGAATRGLVASGVEVVDYVVSVFGVVYMAGVYVASVGAENLGVAYETVSLYAYLVVYCSGDQQLLENVSQLVHVACGA